MRSREEIEDSVNDNYERSRTKDENVAANTELIVELLLDIREILGNNKPEEGD